MVDNPAYNLVQHDLKKSIIGGSYKLGDSLPSENELAAHYGLSRMTIRKAMDQLEADGLIIRSKGKRSTVQMQRKSIGLLSVKGFT